MPQIIKWFAMILRLLLILLAHNKILLIGGLLLVLGLVCSRSAGRTNELTCRWHNTERVDCHLAVSWFGWFPMGSQQTVGMETAYLERRGRWNSYVVVLSSPDNEVVLNFSNQEAEATALIDRFNRFVQTPTDDTLHLQYRVIDLPALIIFGPISVGMLFLGLGILVTALPTVRREAGIIWKQLRQTQGYAPGWRIRCLECGHTRSAAEVGILRVGATGSKKIQVRCSQCTADSLSWAVIEPDPDVRP